MQKLYEFLRENRRDFKESLRYAGQSLRLCSLRGLKAFFLSAHGVVQPESLGSTC